MSTAKNPPHSAIVFLKKYFVLVLILSLVLVVAAVYAATQIYTRQDNSSEYVYQDKSGTKVVLRAAQCGYSVEILKSMSEQFGKTRDQVKALTLHGDGWKKEGCWIKLDTTNEVAVSTEPGKIDTVLDLDQFTPADAPKADAPKADAPKAATGGLKSLFSKGIDPSTQDTFAYAPFDAEIQAETLYRFWHDLSCGQVWSNRSFALQKGGYDPYTFKAGKIELGVQKDGQWNVLSTLAVCYRDEPQNKRILVLVRNAMVPFPYGELSTEPFKVIKAN